MKNETQVYGGETQVPDRLLRKLRSMIPSTAKQLAPIYAKLRWPWAVIGVGLQIPAAADIEKELRQFVDTLAESWLAVSADGSAFWRQSSGGLAVVVELEHDGAIECWAGRLEFTRAYEAYASSDDDDEGEGS